MQISKTLFKHEAYLYCYACATKLSLDATVSRSESCSHCGRDVRVCKNCQYFSMHVHNQCLEPGSEWVADKERSNFCDDFQPRSHFTTQPLDVSNDIERSKCRLKSLFQEHEDGDEKPTSMTLDSLFK